MKSALKLFYIVLVGMVVFMGALYIAEGMLLGEEARTQASESFRMPDQEEGSALHGAEI